MKNMNYYFMQSLFFTKFRFVLDASVMKSYHKISSLAKINMIIASSRRALKLLFCDSKEGARK
jgi:hypothetical protein